MISESLTWNPLARFYLQASFSYVLNQTDTPANNIELVPNKGATVVNFRNDYWTVTSGIGYIIDDKTNFYSDFSFYCANDHFKNAAVAVPYGLGATEYTGFSHSHAPINQANAPAAEVRLFQLQGCDLRGS